MLKRNSLLVCVLCFCFACSNNIEFTEYKTLSNSTWNINEKLTFNFQVTDTISPKNLFINIRNNQDYEYSNLYVITELVFPNNTQIIDTLQYEMADETGRFLGSGSSSIKENKLYYKENKVFPNSGSYTFSIKQAMRKNGDVAPIETLSGIQDVGFSIETID